VSAILPVFSVTLSDPKAARKSTWHLSFGIAFVFADTTSDLKTEGVNERSSEKLKAGC
jgi:hypothetical protein